MVGRPSHKELSEEQRAALAYKDAVMAQLAETRATMALVLLLAILLLPVY